MKPPDVGFDPTNYSFPLSVVVLISACNYIDYRQGCFDSDSPFQIVFIGGQIFWSLCQKFIESSHLFSSFTFILDFTALFWLY